MADFILSKIESVLKGFKKYKIPGPDGWHIEFYLHLFDLVGHDILNVVECLRVEGRVTGALNATFITLIPKWDKTLSFADFRPISLSNLVYKTISKLATIRLKSLLDKAISRN